MTASPGVALGVYVADCVPALVADARTGACAAVHAGWRGTVAGVLPAALDRMMAELGARAADMRIAIGPSIGPCCFDLWLLNRMAAESRGVPPAAIDVAAICTSCDRARFFSYRRDHGQTGQLAAFIVHDPR